MILNNDEKEYKTEIKSDEIFADYPDVVTVDQLMKMLQIGQVLAYRLVKSGEIKSRKVGREYKIPKKNVIQYLNEAEAI